MPDPNCLLLPEFGLAYYALCKAGNTSIKDAFLSARGDMPDHIHSVRNFDYCDYKTIAQSSLWKFAIVRNPWDRLYSCWKDKVRGDVRGEMHAPFVRRGLISMSWDLWVQYVCSVSDENADQHFRSQSYDLHFNGDLMPDFIGRFEQLPEAWQVIRGHSLLPLPDLAHHRKTSGSYRDAYTQDQIYEVSRRYAKDIRIFEYEF